MNKSQPTVCGGTVINIKSGKKNLALCISGKYWLTDFKPTEAKSSLNLPAGADADIISCVFGGDGSNMSLSDSR
jgi:hypothetical protein